MSDRKTNPPVPAAHHFKIDENGTLTSYSGPGGHVRVPDGTVRIGRSAFELCVHVTKVTLPDSVREIGENAFLKSGVASINLPDGLLTIGKQAFKKTPLREILIPGNVCSIGDLAFDGANQLRLVYFIPMPMVVLSNVLSFRAGRSGSRSLTEIAPGVFRGCSALTEIDLPVTVKNIEGSAFRYCTSLRRVGLPFGIEVIWSYAFGDCRSLESVDLGNNLKALGEGAFQNCSSLKKLCIPKSLEDARFGSFAGCDSLTLEGPTLINGAFCKGDTMYFASPHLTELTVPEDAEDFGDAVGYLPHLRTLRLPEGLESLSDDALLGLTELEVLDLPKSLKYYDWRAFKDLRSLKRVVTDRGALAAEIPLLLDVECVDRSGVPFRFEAPARFRGEWLTKPDPARGGVCITGRKGKIGNTGDADCTTMILPDTLDGLPVTSVDAYAFSRYRGIDALYVPDSVQLIGDCAFRDCTYLRFVRLPKGVVIGDDAFTDTRFTLPAEHLNAPDADGESDTDGSDDDEFDEYEDGSDEDEDGSDEDEDSDGNGGRGRETVLTVNGGTVDEETMNMLKQLFGDSLASNFTVVYDGSDEDEDDEDEDDEDDDGDDGEYGEDYEDGDDDDEEYENDDDVRKPSDLSARQMIIAAADAPFPSGAEAFLQENVWEYFDRISRRKKIAELTHSLHMSGEIDGAGWATVEINLDGKHTRFRISYIGDSLADFKRFVENLEEVDSDEFGWCAEPGYYPFEVQRLGEVVYMSFPNISERVFLPYEQLLREAQNFWQGW